MKLQRKPRIFRETREFIAMDALTETQIEHAGHAPRRHLSRGTPYVIHAALHARHGPAGLDWLRRVHPEQRRHPFVDREADAVQVLGQRNRVGGPAGAGRAADEMDQMAGQGAAAAQA